MEPTYVVIGRDGMDVFRRECETLTEADAVAQEWDGYGLTVTITEDVEAV